MDSGDDSTGGGSESEIEPLHHQHNPNSHEGDDEGDEEEAADEEGVMPSDIEGQSPIDDLKTFDWGSAENELAEFMGSGSDSENDDDSDASSVASNSSRRSSTRSGRRGAKRNHDEITHADGDGDGDESDEGSTLAKKQRVANSRTTGLKSVRTPGGGSAKGSESSLPTPGVTGDEEGDGDEFKDLEFDLEAELEAELAGG